MCGIFGIAIREGARFSLRDTASTLNNLYRFSESRGKESAGLHVHTRCLRHPVRSSPPIGGRS